MNTVKLDNRPVMALLAGAALLIAISATTSAAPLAEDDARRVTLSKHYQGDGRENAVAIKETRDEYGELSPGGNRTAKSRSGTKAKAVAGDSMSPNADFWFYLADVDLYADEDRDGFYSGVDLLFDVDTYYSVADIYAVAYLSLDGGPWEEYAVTEDFTIFGSSGTDDYVIVTDLVAGYPTGDYDILVEIFDADTNDFLAFIGPEDTSELAFLPLEDMDRDAPFGGDTRVTVNQGGGGSFGWPTLLLLVFCAGLAVRGQAIRLPASR
ncbi:MAG: choice-of-anchor H family protein [Woeseiaceae bacterium]